MCGILGWCNFSEQPKIGILRNISKFLENRGPDAYGEFTNKYINLAHRRLSIIDLTRKSNQPILDSDTGNAIVFNGEIYNFQEIKREILFSVKNKNIFKSSGDGEVILLGYKIFGLEILLQKLEGMFAFSIWDNKKQNLIIARDRLGEKPLFYSNDLTNGIIFSSSVKSLTEHPLIKKKIKIDYDSINQYLTFNYLLFEKTFFKNIKQLQPGCYIIFNKNKSINNIKEKQYWFLEKIFNKKKNKNITLQQAKEKMLFLVNNSIKSRINSDVKIGTYLSGGLDSSLISLQLKKINNHNMLAHNISFKENSYDESFYARYLARKMDFNLKVHLMPKPKTVAIDFSDIVSAMDQPMADTAFISNFYLAKLSSKYSKVVLSGDGVDEMLCGYETYVADIIKNYSDLFPKFLINMSNFFFSNLTKANTEKVNLNYKIKKFFENNSRDFRHAHILWRSIFNQEEKNKIIKNNLFTNNFFNKILKNYKKVRSCHFLDQHMYIDLITWFPNDILYKIDRTTMFHSQEGRIPFLDTKVLEFCCSLPINLKIKVFQKKFILKKILSEKISHFFVNRKKSGFNSPVGSWIKNDKNFKEMTFSLLTTDNMSSFFDKKQLIELFTRHIKNIEDNTYKIFTLIVLSQWLKSNNIKI